MLSELQVGVKESKGKEEFRKMSNYDVEDSIGRIIGMIQAEIIRQYIHITEGERIEDRTLEDDYGNQGMETTSNNRDE